MEEIKCPECNSPLIVKYGYTVMRRTGKHRLHHCNNCGKTFQTNSLYVIGLKRRDSANVEVKT